VHSGDSAQYSESTVARERLVGAGIDPQRGPDPFGFSFAVNLEDVDIAAHEWVGLLYYRLRGYTRELFPAPR
jgi:hypothetical protein